MRVQVDTNRIQAIPEIDTYAHTYSHMKFSIRQDMYKPKPSIQNQSISTKMFLAVLLLLV